MLVFNRAGATPRSGLEDNRESPEPKCSLVDRSTNDVDAWFDLGYVLWTLQQIDAAVQSFRQVVHITQISGLHSLAERFDFALEQDWVCQVLSKV
jgi:hypothetical protein